MKLYDIKTKSKIPHIGRRVNSQKACASANDLNPITWSKWLYEIRRQIGRGTSRAEAYEDCRQHYCALNETLNDTRSDEKEPNGHRCY